MSKSDYFLEQMPKMKFGNELVRALSVLPEYSETIRKENQAVRLMALSNLYKVYIPSQMSIEIYNKLYLALLHSLQKKTIYNSIIQRNKNHRAIFHKEYNGIIGGSDSFTIIGKSGIGKSSAINRAIGLITENQIIEIEKPFMKIIPCMIVQCPFDSSVKGLLLEMLRKVDEELDSNYYQNAVKNRTTTDMLIGIVSQIALNHIGLLIVDEIQNVVNSKNGKSLIGSLTQLINNSGISICMVGTPESTVFFEQAMHLARRSLGLNYNVLEFDVYFQGFCKAVFSYQYLQNKTEITDTIVEWLYEHSAGVISIVISLIHDAQEIAILNGRETLDIESLNEAYQKRITLLHDYIQPCKMQLRQTSKPKKKNTAADILYKRECNKEELYTIHEIIEQAKEKNVDTVMCLKKYYPVVEVVI